MDPHFHGVIFRTHAGELIRRIERPLPPYRVVDTRWRGAYDEGHVPGAVSILPEDLKTLPEGTTAHTEFFVIGEEAEDPGMRKASLALRRLGAHRVVEVTGGMVEWRLARGPIEAGATAKAA